MTGNFSGPLEERMAIRELLETYADAVYRADEQLWGSLWCDDATWSFPHLPQIGQVTGKARLLELYRSSAETYPNISVIVVPASIHVAGAAATGRFYVSEIYEDGHGRATHGRPCYRDNYMRRDGRWYIQSRISTPRKFTS